MATRRKEYGARLEKGLSAGKNPSQAHTEAFEKSKVVKTAKENAMARRRKGKYETPTKAQQVTIDRRLRTMYGQNWKEKLPGGSMHKATKLTRKQRQARSLRGAGLKRRADELEGKR